jgi:hypothetical protein
MLEATFFDESSHPFVLAGEIVKVNFAVGA